MGTRRRSISNTHMEFEKMAFSTSIAFAIFGFCFEIITIVLPFLSVLLQNSYHFSSAFFYSSREEKMSK